MTVRRIDQSTTEDNCRWRANTSDRFEFDGKGRVSKRNVRVLNTTECAKEEVGDVETNVSVSVDRDGISRLRLHE